MKIRIKHAGSYDPRLGASHPSNQDPTLEHFQVLGPDAPGNGCACGERWPCAIGNAAAKKAKAAARRRTPRGAT